MRNNWIKHISFIILVFLLPFTVNSQNNNLSSLSIIVEFKSAPVSVNITHTPLKYNKAFALSFTMDDGPKDIYTHAFKLLNGGNIEGVDYEPLCYTDGCGNDIKFTMSAAVFSFSNFNSQDMHEPGTDFDNIIITWPEINEMYQNGCGIFNHGLTSASTGDYNYLVARNHSYIKYKTQDARPGGIHPTIFVNPNGAAEFTNPAFDQGYNAAYRSIAYGVDYLNVFSTSSIINLDKLEIGRQELTTTNNFSLLADQLYQDSNTIPNTSPWASTFSHTVTGQYGGISFNSFKNYVQYIALTYGKNGMDNIWFTTEEEVLDYILVRDAIVINQETVENEIRLTFSGATPEDLRNYALSLNIASTATDTITAVAITGDLQSSYSTLNTDEVLINTSWDGADITSALEMAEFYVDSTESSLSQNVANIAMDYVNIVAAGIQKDNLKARLCAIPQISMPVSFCRTCSTNIGDDEIICNNDCVELTVTEGDSYLWDTGETTQNIEVCPNITTDYRVKVWDEFGCEAKDTVRVIVNPLPTSQTSNDTIVCKNNCVKIWVNGGSNYLWDTGETTDTIQICPSESIKHYVTIYNENNCQTIDSVFIDIFPAINANAGNDVNLNEGNCVTLTASGGLTQIWSTGETTQNIEVCPTETTKYYLTAFDDNGCSDTDSVNVILRLPLKLGDGPVGVSSIIVIFETNPTLLNISKTPLKFDKEFALSFHIKNAHKDIYTHAFPFLNGGLVDGVNYPGLTFTDGCDNEVNFKMGTSLYSFAADGITDIHAQSNNFINWTEAIELYQAGWGIFSQGVLPDNSGDPSYSIARNHSYVKSKTFQSITGGIPMTVLMNPEGDTTFSTTAFDQDYRAAFASYTKGIQYYNIDLIPNSDSLKMGINSMDNQQSLAALADLMHNNHSYATRFWASANLSTITDGNINGYTFSTFRFYMDYIESKYGSGGLDNIWMTNEEEVWDYLTIYDLTTIHRELLDDRLLITFSGSLPTHLNNYALSLLIESDANIQSIEINGGVNNTFKIKADTSALINLNWDGKVLIADSVLAENYVVIAETNRTTNDVLVAIDYVNMLDFGSKKIELRNRLCAITEATLPLGYCDCEFSLGNDTTICKNDCIDLTGASGTSYLWSTGATTQTINVCPSDTTEYWLTVFNVYDCYFTDTILVNVIPDNFAHASADMIICESSCVDLTVTSGASYLWTTGKTTQTITVCPDVEKKYYAIVTDALGCVSIDSVTISIEELPTTQISADVSICKFDSTILTISGATNYLWSTHDDTNSIKVSPADTTKYYVWSWNENNCLIKDSVTVNIIPLPLAQAGNDTTICFGDCVTLSANNEYIHEWSTNETTQNIDVCPIDTTTYYLTVTNEQNCSNIDSVKVFVNPIPETLSSNDTIICPGECVKIWVNGGINYLWDTEETTDTIEVCPTESTMYYVSVYNDLACETTDSVYVEVFNATNVSLTDDLSICPDDCITLTAAGGYAYEWSTGGNNNKITVCPEADSMYYVTVYNEFNCSATDSVLVSLRTPPIVDAGLDSEICFGDCATLTASDGSAYYWNTDETSQSIEVCPTDTSTYYVTVEDQFGCTNIDSVTINVKPTPETLTSNDTIVCPRECIKIWVSGGSNYLWDTGETTDTIEVCPTEATRYYVSVFNDLGCETIDDVFVNVYANANANAGEDVSICPGSCVTLVATGGYGYDWGTGAETNTIEVCPEETTWYSVSVRNEYNCYTTDSVLVTLLTPPTVDAGIDVSKCISDCIDLEATGALTYLWSTESSSNIIEVCPSIETKYYVTGTDEFGCSSIDSVTVEINDHPDVILSGLLPVYCEGASSVLLEGSPANGSFGGNGVNGNIFSPSNAGLGQHQVYYSIVDNTGCAIADTINVNIYEVPDFSLGEDVTLCSDDTLEIFIPSGYDQYLWSNGNTSNNYLMVEFSRFGMGTTVVELVATNNGCVARDEIQITFVSCNVGIEDLEDIGIKIYPNPNSGIFRITYDGSEDNQYFSIYNMQGQEVYAKELNECYDSNCSIDIDASFLNKGMYLIRFFSKKGIRTAKLIIQ